MTWQDDLHENGIMMSEYDVASALIEGVAEKTSMIDSSPTISIATLDGCGFCSALDANITAIAPSFLDENNSAYSSDLSELCSAAGYNTVVYGATPGTIVLNNGGVQFNAGYVAQRKDILALFVTHETITLPSSISISSDYVLVKYPEPLHLVFDPADAYSGVTWSTNKPDVATVDANGYVTVHSDGTCKFIATCDKDNTIVGQVEHQCILADTAQDPLHHLVAISGATFTQSGLTLTHNNDGTLTLNGKSTAGSSTYLRFVVWPIGSNKVAHNVKIMNSTSSRRALWFEYISGTFDEDNSTLNPGVNHKWFEIYPMYNDTQLGLKIERYTDWSKGGRRYAGITDYYGTTPFTAIVFGIQVAKNTKINNFKFRIGTKQLLTNNGCIYDDGILNGFLVPIYSILNVSTLKIIRHNDKSFNLWINQSSATSIRLSSSLAWSSSSSNLMTGETFGTIGHTYKFTVIITQCVIDEKANTSFEFYIKAAGNTSIASIKAINNPGAITDGVDRSGTYDCTFTLTKAIDMVGVYANNVNPTSLDSIDFALKLEDITE